MLHRGLLKYHEYEERNISLHAGCRRFLSYAWLKLNRDSEGSGARVRIGVGSSVSFQGMYGQVSLQGLHGGLNTSVVQILHDRPSLLST